MVTQPMMGESILAVGLMVLFFHINPILGNSCPSTTATIKIVDECPKTEQAWKDAAARKGCHMLAATQYCSKFQYHCLVNQWQNATLEVCAPIWYISGFCVMFNTDEKRVIDNFGVDCTNFKDPCPTRYISTDAYKYQKCYDVVNKIKELSTHFHEERGIHTPNSSETSWEITAMVFIIITTILLSVGILFVVMYARRRQCVDCHNARDSDEENVESGVQDLNNTTQDENTGLLAHTQCGDLNTTPHNMNRGTACDLPDSEVGDLNTSTQNVEAALLGNGESRDGDRITTAHSMNSSKTCNLPDEKVDDVCNPTSPRKRENIEYANTPDDKDTLANGEEKSDEKVDDVCNPTSPRKRENIEYYNTPDDKDTLANGEEKSEKNVSNNLQSEEKIGANDDTHRNKDPVLDDEEKKEENKANDGDTHSLKGEEEKAGKVQTGGGPSTSCENTATNKISSSVTSNTSDHKSLSDNNDKKDGNVEDKENAKLATEGNEDSGQTEVHTLGEYTPRTVAEIRNQLLNTCK